MSDLVTEFYKKDIRCVIIHVWQFLTVVVVLKDMTIIVLGILNVLGKEIYIYFI